MRPTEAPIESVMSAAPTRGAARPPVKNIAVAPMITPAAILTRLQDDLVFSSVLLPPCSPSFCFCWLNEKKKLREKKKKKWQSKYIYIKKKKGYFIKLTLEEDLR